MATTTRLVSSALLAALAPALATAQTSPQNSQSATLPAPILSAPATTTPAPLRTGSRPGGANPIGAPLAPTGVLKAAGGNTLFAGGSNGGGNPGTFQVLDGAFAGTIVSTPSATAFTGFTEGLDGRLWAAEQISGGFSGHNLLELNKTTGAVISSIAMTGGGGRISDLATQPGTGTIYATGSGTFGDIYTLNTTTGALTFLGNCGVVTGGLAFDAAGTLFAISVQVATPLMAVVDPSTGLATSTFAFGPDVGIHAASFRPSDGALIGAQGAFGGSAIASINPTTGATANLGTTGTGAVCIAYEAPSGGGAETLVAGGSNGGGNPGTFQTLDTSSFAGTIVSTPSGTAFTGFTKGLDGTLWAAEQISGGFSGHNLLSLDETTGAVLSSIPMTGGGGRISDLATQPGTGTIYATGSGTFGDIYTLDTGTGALTFLGNCGVVTGGLAFASDGTLYAISVQVATPIMATVDPATGLATSTFAFGPDAGIHSASFRPSDGALIGSQGAFGGSAIVEIDPTTGATTNLGTTGTGAVCIVYCGGGGGGGPETLYAAIHGGPGIGGPSTLYTLDKSSAAATPVGAIGFSGVTGLAVLNDGRLVGSANDGANSILIDIDRATGAGTLIGIIGAAGGATSCVRVGGLAYDSGSNTLYGLGDQCAGSFALDTLLTINTTTGAGTPVVFGAHGSGFFLGSAWDDASGQLYSNDGSLGLFIIDPATSAETLVGGPGAANAMAIDSSGVAYGSTNSGDLKTIDLATGNETFIGSTGIIGLDALVFDGGSACPPVTATTTVRLGTPPNPNVFGGATQQPIIGTTWDPRIDHTTFMPAAILDFAAFSAFPANISLPFGTLLCALPHFGATLVGASTPFAFPIPNDCGLTGLSLCSAAGSLGGGGAIGLTNALDIVIGTN